VREIDHPAGSATRAVMKLLTCKSLTPNKIRKSSAHHQQAIIRNGPLAPQPAASRHPARQTLETIMSPSRVHEAIRPLLAALAIAAAAPASAAVVSFTGTEMNSTPPPGVSGSCAPGQLFIAFSPSTAVTSGTSNFGSFGPSGAHCLTPPPTTYSGGVFTFAFDAGDSFTGSYSGFFTPSDVANVLNNTIEYVVTGGTGRFLGATGTIQGVGTLDRRVPSAINTLALSGALNLPAVPEPATWAMLVLGFGGIGGVLRASRRRAELAA
jgi:hypothetical protein